MVECINPSKYTGAVSEEMGFQEVLTSDRKRAIQGQLGTGKNK